MKRRGWDSNPRVLSDASFQVPRSLLRLFASGFISLRHAGLRLIACVCGERCQNVAKISVPQRLPPREREDGHLRTMGVAALIGGGWLHVTGKYCAPWRPRSRGLAGLNLSAKVRRLSFYTPFDPSSTRNSRRCVEPTPSVKIVGDVEN